MSEGDEWESVPTKLEAPNRMTPRPLSSGIVDVGGPEDIEVQIGKNMCVRDLPGMDPQLCSSVRPSA